MENFASNSSILVNLDGADWRDLIKEIYLGGATGTGKTTIGNVAVMYQASRRSCTASIPLSRSSSC